MSESMGPLTFGKKEEQIFLGREIAQHQDYSEDTAHQDRPGGQGHRRRRSTSARGAADRADRRPVRIADALLGARGARRAETRSAGWRRGEPPRRSRAPARRAAPADRGRSRRGSASATPVVPPLPPIAEAGAQDVAVRGACYRNGAAGAIRVSCTRRRPTPRRSGRPTPPPRRAHARHGDPQRDTRFVLRRRPVSIDPRRWLDVARHAEAARGGRRRPGRASPRGPGSDAVSSDGGTARACCPARRGRGARAPTAACPFPIDTHQVRPWPAPPWTPARQW